MSNFKCEKCGTNITEDEHGNYVTECEHYPLFKWENATAEQLNEVDKIDKEFFTEAIFAEEIKDEQIRIYYQPLFNLMVQEHETTLTESEMQNIVECVMSMNEYKRI